MAPQGSLTALPGGCNLKHFLGCGNRMIRVLKVHHSLDNSLPMVMPLRKSTQDAPGGLSEQHLCFLSVFDKYYTFPESWHSHLLRGPPHSWRQWLQHGASWSSVLSPSGRIITFWFKHSLCTHLAEQKSKQNSTALEAIQKNAGDVFLHVSLSEGDWATLKLQPQLIRPSVQRTPPKAGFLCTAIWAPLKFWTSRVKNTFPPDRAIALHNLHSVTTRAFGCLFFP